jgi:hypothetical protein
MRYWRELLQRTNMLLSGDHEGHRDGIGRLGREESGIELQILRH